MLSKHFIECPSTQTQLSEHLEQHNIKHYTPIVFSCSKQTQGHGQRDRVWTSVDKALAFSFLFPPNPNFLLTSLELAILVVQFFAQKFQQELRIKWPNDILNRKNEKCGGIVIKKNSDEDFLIVGIGLNLWMSESEWKTLNQHYQQNKTSIGYIFENPAQLAHLTSLASLDNYKKEVPEMLVQFFHQHRMKSVEQIQKSWAKSCAHWKQEVEMGDLNNAPLRGTFEAIGLQGEAIIRDEKGKEHHLFNGPLRFHC